MSGYSLSELSLEKLSGIDVESIGLLQDGLVSVEPFRPDTTLPLVARPAVENVNVYEWARANRQLIEAYILKYGAILFRDFGMNSVDDFQMLVEAISEHPMEYRERSSPRSQVGDRIYTSTNHPVDQSIFPHNEHSYSKTFPLRLYFFCLTPALEGGQTPIADTRKIFARISAETREGFRQKKWMYVRNFNDGFGLTWQTVYQTTDKPLVTKYCGENNIQVEWKAGDRLRTRQIRPATAIHPRTGETVWFNHATFFHVTTLDPILSEALLASFKEEDLPNNTYYGDGSPIEPRVLDELRAAYQQEMVYFTWQKGDVLLLDNMLTAHARTSYVGPREILVAMAEPHTRQDI